LRFFDRKENSVLDYSGANSLRQKGTGFRDQAAEAVETFKRDKSAASVVLQFATGQNPVPVFQAWLYCRDNKLNVMVWAGYLDNRSELIFKYVPVFSFLLQTVSDLTGIDTGCVRFVVGCLCGEKSSPLKKIRTGGYPAVNIRDFKYPSGGLCLRDMDVLMSIMVEFVSRLDTGSLERANPFEGDVRVQMWSDYAEIFRTWKAEKLGYRIEREQNFFHPQLRFIYKGEAS
jgi:hypothetical protein